MSTDKHTVSDMELMQYFDGELAADAAGRVEAFLASDRDARDKIASLTLGAELVLERNSGEDDRADGIADAVMAALDAPEEEVASDRDKLVPMIAPPEGAANDNAKTIYMVAAAAAAIAAGFFLWGRTGAESELAQQADEAKSKSGPTSLAPAAEAPPAAMADRADDAASEDEALGVEIAAVDFGSQSGSVFYVSGGKAGATAVVWVSDTGEE